MAQIKSFETFLNEGLTTQYLNPVNEGFETDHYTYRTKGEKIRPFSYADKITGLLATGKLTAADLPGYIKKYGTFEGPQTADQLYSTLLAAPNLAKLDQLISEKATKSETAEELAKWKADPAKKALYALLLVDLDSNDGREDYKNALSKNRSSVIVAGVQTKTKVTQPGTQSQTPQSTTPPNAISVPFTYSQNGSKGDVFVVNEWILSDSFKAAIDQILQEIKQTVDTLTPPADKPKAFCSTIIIESSCSTAPNGTPKSSPGAEKYAGKTISFMDLSKERANSVLNYIKTGLSSVGVLVDSDTKIEIKYLGQNGDGTSGPAWNTVEGADNAAKLAQVKQYQMAKADFEILFNTTSQTITTAVEERPQEKIVPPQVVEVPAGEYKLTIALTTFRLRIKFPKLHFPTIRLPKIGSRRNWGSTKCFKF